MNFTQVRGFNAYAQFSARIREAVKSRDETQKESGSPQDNSRSTYSEPIDTVTISEPARSASATLAAMRERAQRTDTAPAPLRENVAHTEFREWRRMSGAPRIMSGAFTQKIPGSVMNDMLSGSGLSVGNDEEYTVRVDVMSTISVASRNAEKAKAIQDLLRSTPSGINWGLLTATLPPV